MKTEANKINIVKESIIKPVLEKNLEELPIYDIDNDFSTKNSYIILDMKVTEINNNTKHISNIPFFQPIRDSAEVINIG